VQNERNKRILDADKRRFITGQLNFTRRREDAKKKQNPFAPSHLRVKNAFEFLKSFFLISISPRSSASHFSFYFVNTKTPTLADRRFDSDTDLKTTRKSLGFGKRFDAGSAQTLGDGRAAFCHFRFLNVDIPFVAGGLLGPGPVVTKLGTLATLLTLSHNTFAPLLSCVRSFPPLCIRWLENLSIELAEKSSPNRFDTITV
jgi:hypothetical protein